MTLADWDPPLARRHGGMTRLCGLDIWHDFDWFARFGHTRAQFPGGQPLTAWVRAGCPAGKRAALVLTVNPNEHERIIENDDEFIVVCDIERYLAQPEGSNRAVAHFGGHLGPGIVGMTRQVLSQDQVEAFVETQMDWNHIARWADLHPDQAADLNRIAGAAGEPQTPATPAQIAAAISGLDGLDPEIIDAIAAISDSRLDVLHALTARPEGRADTSAVIVERTPQRLADARAATDEYEALLAAGEGETPLQTFIEANPWLLGLEYTTVRHRHAMPRGQMDFVLDRYDGYHDVLELKSPQDEIIVAPPAMADVPPPAHAFSLSPALANALAQAHVYRDVMNEMDGTIDHLYGLRETRDPLLIIVIGQASALSPHRLRVLTELNLSLHRVAIVPYDLLVQRARIILENVGRYLTQAAPADADADERRQS